MKEKLFSVLEGFTCNNCKKLSTSQTTKLHIVRPPNVLTIHFNRFHKSIDGDGEGEMTKTKHISFQQNIEFPNIEGKYDLHVSVVHKGELLKSGHYIAHVKDAKDI